jgi:soluble lytic murein transglycosylase-like protein
MTRRLVFFLCLSTFSVSALAQDTTASSPAAAWDEKVPYAAQVRDAARLTNVQPELLHAIIKSESNYQARARSPAGAAGLMQLSGHVAKRYDVKDRFDPQQNIQGGARYLRDLLDLFKENVSLVLAAYNAGEHTVARYGNRVPPFSETRAYVQKVTALYDKLSGASRAASVPAQSDIAPVVETSMRIESW